MGIQAKETTGAAMSQMPVKWVNDAALASEQGKFCNIPVIPLSALLEWLKEVNAKSVIPCAIAPELAATACFEINQMAQYLLAGLGEVGRE